MAFSAFHTSVKRILLLAHQPTHVSTAGRVIVETRHDPTENLVHVVSFGNHVHFRHMGTQEAVGRGLHAGHHIAVYHTQALARRHVTFD